MMRKVLTFIMAGGKGERLLPLTKDRTKPAVPFGGIYRIIDFTLSNCINSGMRKIYILTQYKSASLQRHIRLGWNFLPSELGQFIELLPIRPIDFTDPADRERHDRMVALVEEMLALHRRLAVNRTDHEQTNLQRQIDAADRRIDRLVYDLYDLTEEEIRIIEKD